MNHREDQPNPIQKATADKEPEAPRTPPIPRGIEVLLKKAAVDCEFRQLLLELRGGAATAIELQLTPAETAMLEAIPAAQLAQLISQTVVPTEQRRVFLGRVAAAMLAVVGASLAGCTRVESAGARPERPGSSDAPPAKAATNSPPVSRGISPDRP